MVVVSAGYGFGKGSDGDGGLALERNVQVFMKG